MISTAKLVRPILYVEPLGQNRYAPVAPQGGRIRYALERRAPSSPANPARPGPLRTRQRVLRHGRIRDGQVMPTGGTGGDGDADHDRPCRRHRMERAQPQGAACRRPVSGAARASRSTPRSAKPLILFAGGSAPVSIDIKAAPASGSFDGVANFSQNSFFDGQLTFNSPSLRRMLEWSRTDLPPGALDRLGRAVGQDHRQPQAAQVRQCRGHARRQSGRRRARPVARRGRAGDQRHAGLRPARPALLPGGLHAVHAGLGFGARRDRRRLRREIQSRHPPFSGQGDGRRFLLHATSRRRRRSRATSPRSTFPMRRSSAAPCRPASATTARATAAISRCGCWPATSIPPLPRHSPSRCAWCRPARPRRR